MLVKQLLSQIKKNAIRIHRYGQKRDILRGKEEINRFMRGVDSATKKIAKENNMSQGLLLTLLEKNRSYWALNFYSKYNLSCEVKKILKENKDALL